MKVKIHNIDNNAVGELDLADSVFAVTPRRDILFRMVMWQQAKARAGTHKAKTIADISGTTRKPHAQKGTGHARQGSRRSPQFRKGAVIFGPVVRSHEHELPKKVRALALRMALSAKQAEGKLIVLDQAAVPNHKTKELAGKLEKMGVSSVLVVGGATLDDNFVRAARNLPFVDVLPTQGANVYDIMRRDTLVLTQEAVAKLEERLA
ncbi:MAG: 50S ribosomal protein L4 [Alphaproteobacteria bacterium]|nr:MAG: 50S ribosomal protein L4 [Alphaproteobacteria bacterium]